ncbi:MAG: helix-turn-helix transcriptional regulator [Chloroflexota bacterium]
MKEYIAIPNSNIGKIWYTETPSLDYFHSHDELECNIVVRGNGSYLLENQRINLDPQTIAWLFPGQEHLMLDVSDDFALWIFVIKPSYLLQTCLTDFSQPLLAHNPAGVFVRHIENASFSQLESMCQTCSEGQHNTDLFNATLGYLLQLSWNIFQQGSMIPFVQKIHPAVQQVAHQLLEAKGDDALTYLAEGVGLSPETVSRLFKQQTGIPLSTYRNRCRLERFLTQYGDGHTVTMLDAALASGFGSYAQFYRVFCSMMRQTPAEYRRKMHQ